MGRNPPSYSPFATRFVCYIPENWNVDWMLQLYPPNVSEHKDNAQKIKDRVIYIASAYYRSRQSLNDETLNDETFVSLNSGIFQSAFRGYHEYLKYLIEDVEVLECDDDWSRTRHKSRSYRFSAKYRNQVLKEYVIYDPKFIDQITKHRRAKIAHTRVIYPVLYNWLGQLSIRESSAFKLLEDLGYSPEKTKFQYELVQAVNTPAKWIFQVGATGRLFTHISFLQKDVRKLLKYQGMEELVELDIRNCIAFLSIALLDKQLYERLNIHNKLININKNVNRVFSSLLTLVEMINYGKIYEDVEQFKEDVISGEIYDKIVLAFNLKFDTSFTREEGKQKILNVWNRPPDMECRWKEIQRELYPHVIEVFDSINVGFFKTKKGRGARAWQPGDQVSPFAYLTQSLESEIILKRIVPRVTEMNPRIPIYTIHDSIMTTKSYAVVVKKIMEEEIVKMFGVAPEIRIN